MIQPPSRGGRALDPCDAYLLKILTVSPSLESIDVGALETWWLTEGPPEEGLAAFLVRQGLLLKEACRAIEVLHKSRVAFHGGERFLTNRGLELLRDQFSKADVLAPPEEAPAAQGPEEDSGAADGEDHLQATDMQLDAGRLGQQTEETEESIPEEPAGELTGTLHVGCVLGQCLLTRQLGRGTSGVVFQALHTGLNIPVAVKVLPRHALDHDGSVYRQFKTEARILGQLNHPHVIRLLDFQDDAELPYLVLEYVEGLTLAELIHQSGRLRLDRAVRLIGQVAQGLAAARKQGVVHRDVKPGNILLARDGKAKIADLGLAVITGDGWHLSPAGEAAVLPAGTAAYVAPEQALNVSAIDHRADIYALGATFYHAVTGQLPFTGRSAREVMFKHLQESPVPPHELVPELGSATSAVILKMLAKDPGHRHQEYEELLAALAELPPASPAGVAARSLASTSTLRAPGGSTHWRESGSFQGHLGKVAALAFAPRGAVLATGSADKSVKLWEVATGQERATLAGHAAEVTALAFSPDGRVLASTSLDRTTRLWDVLARAPWATLKGYLSEITAVTFSPDGHILATGCEDGSVKLWDMKGKQVLQVLQGHTEVVTSVTIAPDGQTVATASGDRTVRLWDVATGQERLTLQGHKLGVSSVMYSPGGLTLATGSWDMTVKLWDALTGRERTSLQGHAASVRGVAFAPDGKLLATASWDKTVKVWDVAAGLKPVVSLEHAREVNAVAFAPSGKVLATGADDGTVKLLDVARAG